MTRAWYAVQVFTRQEASAAADLSRRGFQVLCPTRNERRLWSDRIRTQQVPLFPGYLFVCTELDPASLQSIRKARGAMDVVGIRRGQAPAVPESVIYAVCRLVECDRDMDIVDRMPPGTPVTIARGPLKGVQGRVAKAQPTTLAVEVALLGRTVMCRLQPDDLVRDSVALPMRASL